MQWHKMLTNKIPADTVVGKNVNMFWDGIFHLLTLITTVVGVYFLWKLLQRRNINHSGYPLLGGVVMGWGLFNLVEGSIDHHILELHNAREPSPHQDAWNIGLLVFGVVLVILGYALYKKAERMARMA